MYVPLSGAVSSKHKGFQGVRMQRQRSNLSISCREPLQYLTGAAHWRGLVLAVGPGSLIPRPETECLLDFVQQVRLSCHLYAD